MNQVPNVPLNNGVEIPQLGFGVFQVPPDETSAPVARRARRRLPAHRHRALYGNEDGVGQALARVRPRPRRAVRHHQALERRPGLRRGARARFDESLERLGLDYVDLYLIHWPRARARTATSTPGGRWRSCYADGRARAIGVSNFTARTCSGCSTRPTSVPAVNQVELHPRLPAGRAARLPRRARHRHRGVEPARPGQRPARRPAARRDRRASTARRRPRWCCAGTCSSATSSSRSRCTPSGSRENIDVFDFELADDDIAAISGLNVDGRLGPDPDRFG